MSAHACFKESIKLIVHFLPNLQKDHGIEVLQEIGNILANSDVSPFEILHSGLVGKLLMYLTSNTDRDGVGRLGRLFRVLHVFLNCPVSQYCLCTTYYFRRVLIGEWMNDLGNPVDIMRNRHKIEISWEKQKVQCVDSVCQPSTA